MFPCQINSRDLFFSNPADHFLGDHGGLRKSSDSGFNSSNYNQTSNSKDLLSTDSGDIFSQSQKNIVAESQRNVDYQNYILHNPLFGKNKKEKNKYCFKDPQEEGNESNNLRSMSAKNNHISNEFIEIKTLMECLNEGIAMIKNDILEVKVTIRKMEIQIINQNEKIASFENKFDKQSNLIKEVEKKCNKNDEDNLKKLQKLLIKNTDEFKEVLKNYEGSKDVSSSKILEGIKKVTTAQTNGNKKLLQEIMSNNERILRRVDSKMDKKYTELEIFFETAKINIEKSTEIKNNDLKTSVSDLNDTIKNLIATRNIQKSCNDSDEYKRMKFWKPLPTSEVAETIKSGYNEGYQNETNFRKPFFNIQNSVHTPLAETVRQPENFRNLNYKRSRFNRENTMQKQEFNIKRRFTPNLKPDCSPFARKKSEESLKASEIISNRRPIFKKTCFSHLSQPQEEMLREQIDWENDSGSKHSSPYLTVLEAIYLTKNEEFERD